ncbi:hypothetical protein SK128_019566 [Halocaridina rubra]|uniref:Uncharacterized protein n=1 Tax=Halocaridina rubra TaxID=373956 RepID=A0AAN8WU67_HALRR
MICTLLSLHCNVKTLVHKSINSTDIGPCKVPPPQDTTTEIQVHNGNTLDINIPSLSFSRQV